MNKKNYLMRVGRSPRTAARRVKRSDATNLIRNARPDHGFLIRIGRPDPSLVINRPTIVESSLEPILTRNERADKGFLTRVGKADKSFMTRVGRSTGNHRPLETHFNQAKKHKPGNKAYFLTRVGRAGETTKRKSYFTRIGR